MLVLDQGFWNDCFTLGLGPDPKKIFSKGFGGHPPDALTFSSNSEVLRFVLALNVCQRIDASWLLDEIKNNYVFMSTRGASLYVRNSKVPFLLSRGWQVAKQGLQQHD